ncbi:helix-turn-helix domain-containing protein [Candidatus Poriferisodalis sp.]|uniref:helix-turn-helix domain-containing protein n=1 Tax=Candidatus Poriferisodalis sp. TaxID=3101277 RepID=UPI003B025784
MAARLSLDERVFIESSLGAGRSVADVAQRRGRDRSTVHRELARCAGRALEFAVDAEDFSGEAQTQAAASAGDETSAEALLAVAAADDALVAAQWAHDEAVAARAHADVAEQARIDADNALAAAQQAESLSRSQAEVAVNNAEALEHEADVAYHSANLALLQNAATPQTITFDDNPAVAGGQLQSTIRTPLIASFDKISARVSVRTSQRATETNRYGTSHSQWSPWSIWSTWSPVGHDLDADGDELGNGIQDDIVGCPIPTPTPPQNNVPCASPAEPYVDSNGNGRWDHGETFTDSNSNSNWDAEQIAEVHPPGHAQAGQPTGRCYPRESPCLPPPDGTGASDVVCRPRGS